jgi:G3E family GTPase
MVQLNKLDLAQPGHRAALRQFLASVKASSPVLHLSFSADPAPAFLEKLMAWLRREIHPALLVTIGLQPTIGAGCLLRTTNKYFDFSLRQRFADKRQLLQAALQLPELVPTEPIPVPEAAA